MRKHRGLLVLLMALVIFGESWGQAEVSTEVSEDQNLFIAEWTVVAQSDSQNAVKNTEWFTLWKCDDFSWYDYPFTLTADPADYIKPGTDTLNAKVYFQGTDDKSNIFNIDTLTTLTTSDSVSVASSIYDKKRYQFYRTQTVIDTTDKTTISIPMKLKQVKVDR